MGIKTDKQNSSCLPLVLSWFFDGRYYSLFLNSPFPLRVLLSSKGVRRRPMMDPLSNLHTFPCFLEASLLSRPSTLFVNRNPHAHCAASGFVRSDLVPPAGVAQTRAGLFFCPPVLARTAFRPTNSNLWRRTGILPGVRPHEIARHRGC